ncbi:hypothetical protein [Paraburkholderia sp. D1E]|uniref:hypothetical protein n=1 Tax=Paraburkholderia sp. D1E TaxID=3461398 RepID=UPI004045803E
MIKHARLRENSASAVTLGQFYEHLLQNKLWQSQTSLAVDLGISAAQVSRACAAARLPVEVIQTLEIGGGSGITVRKARAIALLIEALGTTVVQQNARLLRQSPQLALDAFVSAIINARKDSGTPPVRLVDDERAMHIRIESPEIRRMFPHIAQLERLHSTAVRAVLATG